MFIELDFFHGSWRFWIYQRRDRLRHTAYLFIVIWLSFLYRLTSHARSLNNFLYTRLLHHDLHWFILFDLHHLHVQSLHYLLKTVCSTFNFLHRFLTHFSSRLDNTNLFYLTPVIRIIFLRWCVGKSHTMKRLLFMLAYAVTLGYRSLINTDLLPKLFFLIVFRHNITQRVFKMKEETPINRQLFTSKQATEGVD